MDPAGFQERREIPKLGTLRGRAPPGLRPGSLPRSQPPQRCDDAAAWPTRVVFSVPVRPTERAFEKAGDSSGDASSRLPFLEPR